MTSARQKAEELAEYINHLTDEELSKLPEEELRRIRKEISPLGCTIEGSGQYLNFSVINLPLEYMKKLVTSSMVGYLNRMCDEYHVPLNVPVVPVYDYLQDKSKLDTPENVLKTGNKKTLDEYEYNRKEMEKRIIIKEFLEEMFQFNPEEHVRSSYRPCPIDTTRDPINTIAGKLAVKHLEKTDPSFKAKADLNKDIAELELGEVKSEEPKYRIVKKKKIVTVDGKKQIKNVKVRVKIEDNAHIPDNMKDDKVAHTVREFLPPHDIYARFKMYMEENYEQLRKFVKDAFGMEPDSVIAVNPYSVHDTAEKAEESVRKHRNEVIATVYTGMFGKWNVIEPFKAQRDNVSFHNDNTTVLQEMIKQQEADEKLGRDLMNKRVTKLKKKNIREDGPDAESFKKWREQNDNISKMGASYLGDKADDDMPDNAVEVEVWKIAGGGTKMEKSKFYTAAEDPQVLDDNDPEIPILKASHDAPVARVNS